MRIRTIKPDFWRSEDIAALSHEDRLLFVGLWSYVDDNGVGRDLEQLIVADLYPLDDFQRSLEIVSGGLRRLEKQGLLKRFSYGDGRKYLEVNTWDKHQRISHPTTPRYPQYDAETCTLRSDSGVTPEDCGDPLPGTGNREGEQGTGKGNREQVPRADALGSPAIGGVDRDATSAEIVDAEIVDDEPAAPDHTEGTMVPVAEPERDDVDRVCQAMVASVQRRTGRTPTITRRWRTQARLMLDRDGVTEADALAAIAWSENDDFWRSNILGIPKLREKYPTLSLQAQRPNRRHRKTFRELADELGISDPQPPPVFDETAQLQEKVPF